MNVKSYNTMDYENKWQRRVRKNKPNSNPIKPNLQKVQMNVNLTLTKDYGKKDHFVVRINKPNSNPISVKPKMSANVYVVKDYENISNWTLGENKPKQTQFKPNFKSEGRSEIMERFTQSIRLILKNYEKEP